MLVHFQWSILCPESLLKILRQNILKVSPKWLSSLHTMLAMQTSSMMACILLWSVTVFGVQCDDRKTTLGQAVVDLLPLLQGTVTPHSLWVERGYETILSCRAFHAFCFFKIRAASRWLSRCIRRPAIHPKIFLAQLTRFERFLWGFLG